MTKTEQKLIQLAQRNGGSYCVNTCYGRGPRGGRVSGGARERDAMYRLEQAGLVRIVDRQPWQDINRGYAQGGTSFVFRLI